MHPLLELEERMTTCPWCGAIPTYPSDRVIVRWHHASCPAKCGTLQCFRPRVAGGHLCVKCVRALLDDECNRSESRRF